MFILCQQIRSFLWSLVKTEILPENLPVVVSLYVYSLFLFFVLKTMLILRIL